MSFFPEDIVEHLDGTGLGVVARTWSEQQYDLQTESPEDPLMRPLTKGEVGVQDHITGHRKIVPDSAIRLVDRCMFVRGDICKRVRREDAQSGVVLNLNVQVQVRHSITNVSPNVWFDREEFRTHQPLLLGDYVLCDGWVGQVEEIFNEALMVSPAAQLQPIYELGGRFSVGDKCLPLPEADQHAEKPKEPTDTIIKVTPIAAAISWSAVNQSIDTSVAQGMSRPPKFWSANDFPRLSIMRSRGPVAGTVGERVLFKDPSKATSLGILPVLYSESDLKNQITVDALVITRTTTHVEVLWQDGQKEWVLATDLVPNLTADDYECWPGDFVLWKGEEEKKVAIVQSVSFNDRIACVRWYGTDTRENVAVLELDPLGSSMADDRQLNVFGLRRGEHVLLHRPGSTNGFNAPLVPKVGELEEWVHEMPSRAADGTMEGWRGELTNVAIKTLGFDVSRKTAIGPISTVQMNGDLIGQIVDVVPSGLPGKFEAAPLGGPHNIDWFGQVVELTLEGDVVVELPSSERVTVPIERCSLYRDSDEDQWEIDDPVGGSVEPMDMIDLDTADGIDAEGWETASGEEQNDWGYMDTDGEGSGELQSQVTGMSMPGAWPPSPPTGQDIHESFSVSGDSAVASEISNIQPEVTQLVATEQLLSSMNEDGDYDYEDAHWNRFEVLPQAPVDHAFYSVDPVPPSKHFLARLSKEYRALQSSLPDSILVRAYEDRTDLLRSLIIGPSNTPYEDAPFVIDWRLDTSFPQTPPIAHFLSWTNGNGRVNPNLYEEGKVCLSILGTWAGDKNESWSAARSSILQALVSIQGLVLVREPYFCEPSFEKMRGTEEGAINSRMYSEKAYVLSRGFVRRALEIPLQNLQEEIAWFYHKRGNLSKVIKDGNALIARSLEPEDEVQLTEDPAIARLSAGGILSLRRTLSKLQQLLDARN